MGKSKFRISLPERTVDLCLDGQAQADWEAAEAALEAARKTSLQDARMAGSPAVDEAARHVREVEERMADSILTFRLRAMRRTDWAATLVKYPPAEDSAADQRFGANREAFFAEAIPASIVGVTQAGEPVDFDVEADWDDLADNMTDHQYNAFAEAVLQLNRAEVSVPFSAAASRTIRRSEKGSS